MAHVEDLVLSPVSAHHCLCNLRESRTNAGPYRDDREGPSLQFTQDCIPGLASAMCP